MAFGRLMLAGTAIGAVYVAATDRPPAQRARPAAAALFAEPVATAEARLRSARRTIDGTGLGRLRIEADAGSGPTLLVGIRRAGDRQAARCRVTIGPAPPPHGSRVEVDCTQTRVGDPALRQAGRVLLDGIMREHVAAAIGQRRYDIEGVADRTMLRVMTSAPLLVAGLSRDR